ncbi:unnamed protein product [Mytilus coruscus]|uniref:Endonuclease n=1 Tax=Mytilus coruscus TaxID=42192 RepID=A0A6J8C8A3_MYTCO|nr:unnamed protein product [Mytilus coruscus]
MSYQLRNRTIEHSKMSDSESEVTIQNPPETEKNSAEIPSQPTPTPATVNSEHFEALMNNISQMAKTFHHGSKSSTPGFSIDSFAGLPTEDANLWLDKFDAWIAFHGWNKENEKIASTMRLKLEGGALSWFNGLPNSVKRNSDQLFTKFKDHFSGLHPTWMLEQHLYERCMLPSESLEVYISDIEKRCSRLCKTDRETTTAFIRGLPGSLRVFVIQRDPKYFKNAVQSARLAQESMAGLTSTFEYGASNSVLNKLSDQEKAIKDLKDTISAIQISPPRRNKNTGADISVANPSLISKLRNIGVRVKIDRSDKESILIANNEKVKIIGVISVNIVVGKVNAHVRFYLVPGLEPNIILGIDFLKSKGAVIDFVNRKVTFDPRRQLVAQTDVTVPPRSISDLKNIERDQLVNLLENYSNVFVNGGKLGNCDILQHEISMPCDQKPIRQRPYKIGNKQKQILENMIEDILKQDNIEPSTSPWAAPCLLVAKKNNTEYRFVVDYRKINSITEQDAHPLLTTDDALESLGATQPAYFSCLDLRSGFYQTQISPKSRPYTAWRCHLGLFVIAAPLYALTKKNCDFVWSKECDSAFEHLKSALTSPPILAYPDYDRPFRVYTDASSFALGAVLCQEQSGQERVICYAGRALSKQEQNYGITELECLALVFAIKKFDCYLRFTSFTAYVDHAALKWLLSLKEPTGKFARWVALIQSYNFEIVYRPGSSHGNADGVSRRTYVDSPDDDLDNESFLNILPSYQIHETQQLNTKESSNPIFSPPVRKIACQSVKQCRDIHANADNLFSTTEIKSEQRADNNYKDIIDYLETGRLPKDKDKHRKVLVLQPFYFLHDDILYHVDKRSKRGQRDLNANIQLAIPRKMVPTMLAETHNSLFSGHLGISRSIRRTQRLYFWSLMNSDIENWIKSCELCSERKQPPNPVRAQLSSMPIASMPFERVSTDIMGPLPVSGPSKYQYVLVFICYFTKYVEFIPLSDIRASTVAKAFIENVLCRHGSPSFLHSDRGSNYLSNIVRETCKLFEITKTHTTSYHPQCNGQSKRMMRSVKDMLSKYLDDNKNWLNFLPFIQFAYNTAPSVDTTDYSPFFLVYGRHPKNPIDSNLPNLDVNKTAQEYVTTLLEELEIGRKIAKELIEIRKSEMLKKANKNRDNPNFNVGDIVYLYKPVLVAGIGRTLNRPWICLYYISQKLSEIHVKLRRKSDGKLLKNRVHINRLKRGYVWKNEPYDITPPLNEDAVEPAIISVDETPADFIFEEVQPNLSQSQDNATQNNNRDNTIFSVEKILRKKRIKGKWKYRVKWVGFDSKDKRG